MQDDLDRIDIKVGALDTEIRSLVSQKKQQQAKSKIAGLFKRFIIRNEGILETNRGASDQI